MQLETILLSRKTTYSVAARSVIPSELSSSWRQGLYCVLCWSDVNALGSQEDLDVLKEELEQQNLVRKAHSRKCPNIMKEGLEQIKTT